MYPIILLLFIQLQQEPGKAGLRVHEGQRAFALYAHLQPVGRQLQDEPGQVWILIHHLEKCPLGNDQDLAATLSNRTRRAWFFRENSQLPKDIPAAHFIDDHFAAIRAV